MHRIEEISGLSKNSRFVPVLLWNSQNVREKSAPLAKKAALPWTVAMHRVTLKSRRKFEPGETTPLNIQRFW
jgi:hypothetical protein